MNDKKIKRILIAAGNPLSMDFRGGQPYYFYSAGRSAGFIHDALPLDPSKLTLRRITWNITSLLRYGVPFGFQYSRAFRKGVFERYRGTVDFADVVSYFPLLPPEPWPRDWSVNFYIDATLKQNFCDYGLGTRISSRTQIEAIDQERRNYEAAKRVICRSTWAASSVVYDYGINPDKVHVISPGASLSEAIGDEELHSGHLDLEPMRLGFVGHEWKRKGLEFLLEVSDELTCRGYGVEVIVVGPSTSELPRHPNLRSLGYLHKSVDAARLVREIRSWHFGCLFSRAEALSSFLRECLRLGVPVLARRVGGIPDAVPPGLGFLFEPGAPPDQVADLLISFVEAPERYAELRNRIAARATEFTWDRAVEKFVALWQGSDAFSYGRVVRAHGRPA